MQNAKRIFYMKKIITLMVLKLILLSNVNAQMSVYDDTHAYLSDIIHFGIILGQSYDYFYNLIEIDERLTAQKLKVPISEYENHNIYQMRYFDRYFLLFKNNILEKIIYPMTWSYNQYVSLSRNLFDVISENNYYIMLQWKKENTYSNIGLIKIYKYYYINNNFDENSNAAVLCVYRK